MFEICLKKAFERIWMSSRLRYLYIRLDAAMLVNMYFFIFCALHPYNRVISIRTRNSALYKHKHIINIVQLWIRAEYVQQFFGHSHADLFECFDDTSKATNGTSAFFKRSSFKCGVKTYIFIRVVRLYFNVFALIRNVHVVRKRMTLFKHYVWMFIAHSYVTSHILFEQHAFFSYIISIFDKPCTRSEQSFKRFWIRRRNIWNDGKTNSNIVKGIKTIKENMHMNDKRKRRLRYPPCRFSPVSISYVSKHFERASTCLTKNETHPFK